MPFYFCTGVDLVPNGRGQSKYPRRGRTPGANWIWLDRSPKTALLWLPAPVSDPDLYPFANEPKEVLPRHKVNDLAARVSAPPAFETRLDLLVAEMLMNPPASRWRPLRGSSLRGRYTIWLGPGGRGRNLLWTQAKTRRKATQNYEDTFDRGDSDLDGSTSSDGNFIWDEVQGTGLSVASNAVTIASTSGYCVAIVNAAADTDDMYAEAPFSGLTADQDNACEVGARMQNGTGGSEGYYFSVTESGLPATFREIRQFDDDTVVAGDSTESLSGTMRYEVDGDQHEAFIDTVRVLGPSTNSLFTGHTLASLHMWNTGNFTPAMASFKYGDLSVGAFSIEAEPGSYTVVGVAATIVAGRVLTADPGSYILSGVQAGLLAGYRLAAEVGAYTLGGLAAVLQAKRLLELEPGSYDLAGVAAALAAGRTLDAEPGSYQVTGVPAEFATTTSYELDCEPGSYAVTGAQAGLAAGRTLDAEAGAYTLAGVSAQLLAARLLEAEPGAYQATGVAAELVGPGLTVANEQTDGNGVTSYDASSAFNGPGTSTLRVKPPTSPTTGMPHRFLYVLPVEKDGVFDFGDGFEQLRVDNWHNRLNATLVAPAFPTEPWYGEHDSTTNRKYESFMVEHLVPWIQENWGSTGKEEHWLLGFSKSGYGGLHLLLRHPDVFARAAFWDIPADTANDENPEWTAWEMDLNYGTAANFENNFELSQANLNGWAASFGGQKRLALVRDDSVYEAETDNLHARLNTAGILHDFWSTSDVLAHRYDSGWTDRACVLLQRLFEAEKSRYVDRFTEAADTNLDEHAPAFGTWSYVGSFGSGPDMQVLAADHLQVANDDGNIKLAMLAGAGLPGAAQEVLLTIDAKSDNEVFLPGVRFDNQNGGNGYFLSWGSSPSERFTLWRLDDGTPTEIEGSLLAVPAGRHAVRLRVTTPDANTVRVEAEIDYSGTVGTHDDTSPSRKTSGNAALFGFVASASGGSNLVDDFVVRDPDSPATWYAAAYFLEAEPGVYSIAGVDAVPVAGRAMDAQAGQYSLTGTEAGLLAARLAVADPGAYAITGASVLLARGYFLDADPGAYGISGALATLHAGRALLAEVGEYALEGHDVSFFYSGTAVVKSTKTGVRPGPSGEAQARGGIAQARPGRSLPPEVNPR